MKTQSNSDYPKTVRFVAHKLFRLALVVLTLLPLVYYDVAYYRYTPLTGVDWDDVGNDSIVLQVTRIVPGSPGQAAGLQVGDRLVSIDGQAVTSYNRPLYAPKRAGESVHYSMARGGQRLDIDVIAGDYFERPEYLLDVLPFVLLSLLIYALGLALLLLSAPQDIPAQLVGVVWMLAGLALAIGGAGYTNGSWFAVDVFRAVFALGVYFALAAHLYFPAPLFSARARAVILRVQFALAFLPLAAYVAQRLLPASVVLPPETLASGTIIKAIFYATWFANFSLLFISHRAAREAETRRQIEFILGGTLLGFLPFLLLTALPQLLLGQQAISLPGKVSTLMLVFIPLSYGYVLRRQGLLKLRLPPNRALALVIVGLFSIFTALTAAGVLAAWLRWSFETLVFAATLSVVLAVFSLHNSIQTWVDSTWHDFSGLTARLAEATDWRDFHAAAQLEIAQPMRAGQSAVLLVDRNGQLQLPGAQGESFGLSPEQDGICLRLLDTRRPARAAALEALWNRRTRAAWAGYEWARVFAPLVSGNTLRGILLLGPRRGGGNYSNQDLTNLNTIAQMLALKIADLKQLQAFAALADHHSAPSPADPPGNNPTAKIVLLVNDDPLELETNALALQAQPACYRALTAPGGRAALSVIWQTRPDLLLLDLEMPEMDGFAVLEAMRESKATRNIPAVLLSDRMLDEAGMERLPRNVRFALTKGMYAWDEILARIQAALLGERQLNSAMQQQMRKVMAYIHTRLDEDFSTDELAAHVSVSKDYLGPAFRKETGLPPFEYQRRCRIQRAKELLEADEMSAAEIARMIGLAPARFSQIFQEQVGVRPSAYRSGQRPPPGWTPKQPNPDSD